MPYQVSWSDDLPNTIIVKVVPPKDWEQFHRACRDEIYPLAEGVDGSVAVIFDLTEAPDPAGSGALTNLAEAIRQMPGNIKVLLAVGYNSIGAMFGEIATRVMRTRFYNPDTMDEAYDIIQHDYEDIARGA